MAGIARVSPGATSTLKYRCLPVPTWRPGNGVRRSPVVTVALASQVYFTSYYSTWRVAEDPHGGQAGSLMKEALLHFYQKMLGNSWKLAEGIPQRLVKTEMARESCTYSDIKRHKNENMHRCNSSCFCTIFLVEPPSHSCLMRPEQLIVGLT